MMWINPVHVRKHFRLNWNNSKFKVKRSTCLCKQSSDWVYSVFLTNILHVEQIFVLSGFYTHSASWYGPNPSYIFNYTTIMCIYEALHYIVTSAQRKSMHYLWRAVAEQRRHKVSSTGAHGNLHEDPRNWPVWKETPESNKQHCWNNSAEPSRRTGVSTDCSRINTISPSKK